jgi:hypothetical protein
MLLSLRVLFSLGLGRGIIVSDGAKYIVTTLISIIIMTAIMRRRLLSIRSFVISRGRFLM